MPLHVAPVVSYEALKKNMLQRPRSGLDRFNLTEIGKRLMEWHLGSGGKVRLRDVKLPYPWKADLIGSHEPILRMDAMRAGNSTFRSILRIEFASGNGASMAVKDMLAELGRDPLSTPYWDDKSWETFCRETGLTYEELKAQNEGTMERLGIPLKLQPGVGE
jgi:hypothetical protein